MKLFRTPCPKSVRRAVAMFVVGSLAGLRVEANPSGGVVAQGSAVVTSQGPQMTIQTSGNTLINWGSFNIGLGESTTFIQPSATSVVWNRINDSNPSQILGRLDANGLVVLQNPSGFFVGGQAAISTAGLIMTTSPTPPPDLSGGSAWQFNAPPPAAKIINYGQINSGPGGPAFLISQAIENHGSITAPGGDIGLYAGKQVMVSSRPDGRGLSAMVTLPEGSVNNTGQLIADAGTIALHAQVVNQSGVIQANSIREHNGTIELVADDSLTLASSSTISARGDSQGTSAGGSVTLKSGNSYQDSPTSTIDVSGGAQGGNGGHVEISAPQMGAILSKINGSAQTGSQGGTISIDPQNIILSSSGDSATSGTVGSGDPPAAGTLTLDVNSFSGFSQIDLQALQNITVSTFWSLGDSDIPASLTLDAGNNITFNNGAVQAGKNWALNFYAGSAFTPTPSVISGIGSLTLIGGSLIEAQDGNITVMAGQNVTVGTEFIHTLGGGSINVTALAGNVNTGNNKSGYDFGSEPPIYAVDPDLGGISTGAGGNVTITAGGNIQSFLPTGTSGSQSDAGSGAFGPEPGIVTITAGGNVTGHFVAANSVDNNNVITPSSITAQNGSAGTSGALLALSLVKGDWQVNAPNGNIYLQEVRNPNGVFNTLGQSSTPSRNFFDYNPLSSVELTAQGVHLEGTLLPRVTGANVQILYPASLKINAGIGGLMLGNSLTLFPSLEGQLNIIDAGNMQTETPGTVYNLIMSDSSKTQWTSAIDFGANDHAAVPIHLGDTSPVNINVTGNLQDLDLYFPKETWLTVMGDMLNCGFSGQNLHPSDDTKITVTGKIFNPNLYTVITLSAPLPPPPLAYPGAPSDLFRYLTDAVDANGNPLFFASRAGFFYDPNTKVLAYTGKMDLATEQLLLGPLNVKTYDAFGRVQLNPDGTFKTEQVMLGWDSIITKVFALSQSALPLGTSQPPGYLIGGPGSFDISAASLDLGITTGIVSDGQPAVNNALFRLGTGAAVNVTVAGDLDMFSSSISSGFGGNVTINAGGSINVGSQELLGADTFTRGIYTIGQSDVNVTAQGDIDIAGSRIAAYGGGNINVKSLTGNVNAGSGGASLAKVVETKVDPKTSQVSTTIFQISGSGILASTLPDAPPSQPVGNITVTTPQGNILASAGGITQIPENGSISFLPTITLTAGTKNPDGSVAIPGNIEAGDGGIIGVNTVLSAAGNISGLVVASGNSTINATANVSGTFLAGGSEYFSAGGSVSGNVIAVGGVNVGNGTVSGLSVLAGPLSVGGVQTPTGLPPAASANPTSQTAAAATQNDSSTQPTDLASADDLKKKKLPQVAKTMGRVTVLLPPK